MQLRSDSALVTGRHAGQRRHGQASKMGNGGEFAEIEITIVKAGQSKSAKPEPRPRSAEPAEVPATLLPPIFAIPTVVPPQPEHLEKQFRRAEAPPLPAAADAGQTPRHRAFDKKAANHLDPRLPPPKIDMADPSPLLPATTSPPASIEKGFAVAGRPDRPLGKFPDCGPPPARKAARIADQAPAATATAEEPQPQPSSTMTGKSTSSQALGRLPPAARKPVPPLSGDHHTAKQLLSPHQQEAIITGKSEGSTERKNAPLGDEPPPPAGLVKSVAMTFAAIEQMTNSRPPEDIAPTRQIAELISATALPVAQVQPAAHSLKLSVHSEELGPLRLALTLRGHKLALHIEAADAQAATILERDGDILTRLLAGTGLEASVTTVIGPQISTPDMPSAAEAHPPPGDLTPGGGGGRQPAAGRQQPYAALAAGDGSTHHDTSAISNDAIGRRDGIFL